MLGRRGAAACALMALVLAASAGALVPLHALGHHSTGEATHHHHHGGDHDHDADAEPGLWHGHPHDPATPDHDHPLLVTVTQSKRTPLVHPETAPAAWVGLPGLRPPTRLRSLGPPGIQGVGPPPAAERHIVLRI